MQHFGDLELTFDLSVVTLTFKILSRLSWNLSGVEG